MALRHFWRNKYEPRTPAFFLLRRMDSRIENDLGMQPIWEVILEVEVKGISWLKRWTFKAPARGQSWWRCWLPEWRPWALSRRSRRRWSTRGGCRLCWRWWRSPAFSTKRWRALFLKRNLFLRLESKTSRRVSVCCPQGRQLFFVVFSVTRFFPICRNERAQRLLWDRQYKRPKLGNSTQSKKKLNTPVKWSSSIKLFHNLCLRFLNF